MRISLMAARAPDDFTTPTLRSRAAKTPRQATLKLLRALADEAEVGMVALDVHDGAPCIILYEIFLCVEVRSRGLGTKLLAALEDHCLASGRTCIEVWPRSVDGRSRTDAQLAKWYGRHGYVAVRSGSERLKKTLGAV
jgi:GNAT superfamily N-acetyltransferase